MDLFLNEKEAGALFSPQGVVVAGVSRNPSSLGRKVLNNLIKSGYSGDIYVLHPKATEIDGIPVVSSLNEINSKIDVVVSLVPRGSVMELAKKCVEKGVPILIVISAGFSEVGGEGIQLEHDLLEFSAKNGLRIIGPNSMGVFSGTSFEGASMDLTFTPIQPKPGSLAFLSQSGAIGAVMANHVNLLGMGFSRFVSLGNKPDIDENVLLRYLMDDEATKLIALYLESFSDGRLFIDITRKVSKKKPILVVKSGRTDAGARAAASHTGALATNDAIVDAVFRQTGIIRASDISELAFLAYGISKLPDMIGNRVAVISNAGGPGTIQTDELEKIGFAVNTLSDQTKSLLKEFLPLEASVGNPIDILPSASPEVYRKTAQTVLDSEDVDAAVVLLLPPVLYPIQEMLKGIENVRTSKPLVIVAMGCEGMFDITDSFSYPIFHLPKVAAKVLGSVYLRGKIVNKQFIPRNDPEPSGILNTENEGWLDHNQIDELCKFYGISVVKQKTIHSFKELENTFMEMAKPIVLKAISDKIVHKSDIGAVITGIETEEELKKAYSKLNKILQDVGETRRKMLIQEQIKNSVEVVVGGIRDNQFGPMVMVGTGGILIEILNDVKFHIAPITKDEAVELIDETALGKLLSGIRGLPPYDKEKLADLIVKVGELIYNEQIIQELDMNPVLIKNGNFIPVDIRIKVKTLKLGNILNKI